jgi:hypothetical protein
MIARLIEILESARQRPAMYLGPIDPDLAEAFLNGMHLACFAAGVDVTPEVRRRVTEARGWPWSAMSLARVLRERGLHDVAIVDEQFALEIEALRAVDPA